MGQFSWLYSDTGKQILNNESKDSYLLVPPKFQSKFGKYIKEKCYDGYGHFGEYDVYALVAYWNKDMIPEILRRAENGTWKCPITDSDKQKMTEYKEATDNKMYFEDSRYVGILMACYTEDNAKLEYPIKITTKPMDYDQVEASKKDPKQGWK